MKVITGRFSLLCSTDVFSRPKVESFVSPYLGMVLGLRKGRFRDRFFLEGGLLFFFLVSIQDLSDSSFRR